MQKQQRQHSGKVLQSKKKKKHYVSNLQPQNKNKFTSESDNYRQKIIEYSNIPDQYCQTIPARLFINISGTIIHRNTILKHCLIQLVYISLANLDIVQ
jgi:hypothetical protein